MAKEILRWRSSKRIGKDPDLVLAYCAELKRKHGDLTDEVLVEAARSKSSPLHDLFKWDDAAAAHQYRLYQARTIIGALVVVTSHREPTRYFAKIRTESTPSKPSIAAYVTMTEAMSTPTLRGQVLARALSELRTFRQKYAALKELAEVFAAIDAVRAKRRK